MVAALHSGWWTFVLSYKAASYQPPSYEVCRWACTTTARIRMSGVNTLLLFQARLRWQGSGSRQRSGR
jgi:hypothetical protein